MNRLIVLVIWLLPILLLMVLGERGFPISPFLVGLILLVLFFAVGRLMGSSSGQEESEDKQEKKQLADERIRSLANDLQPFLSVKGWKVADGIVQFEGLLRIDAADALKGINETINSSKVIVILTEGEQNQVCVTLVPSGDEESAAKEPSWWLHGILLLLTIATTTLAGAMHQGVDILRNPANFAVGLPYSIGLLLILGAHELGHYFTARRRSE